MKLLSIPLAQKKSGELFHEDHEKVVKLLALKAAQVKYVLNRTSLSEEAVLDSIRERLLPPVSQQGDVLIQYSLNTYGEFTQKLRLEMQKNSTRGKEMEKWLDELENTLLEMRRIVMQNLSKHPALRPYNLLLNLQEKINVVNEMNQEYIQLSRQKMKIDRMISASEMEEAELHSQPGHETLFRLDESLENVVHEKRLLDEQWLRAWNPLSRIFSKLIENSSTAEWENAQHRMLHLYLTNTINTRDKDVHGNGLVMILRLAVSALESEKNCFKDMSNEEVRETLLESLENPLFVHFQEHARALDATINANQHERNIHPQHQAEFLIRQKISELKRESEKIERALQHIAQQKEWSQKEMKMVWNDANHACQTQLNVEIEKVV